MPSFPNLGDPEIGRIQEFLVGLCPATGVTGAELWTGNCASCHGADGGGSVDAPGVRCATQTRDALAVGRGDRMPSFATLGEGEVVLLEDWLAGTCVQHGRQAADLWSGNCAGCHGADARGGANGLGVQGSNVRCHRAIADAVREGDGKMPAFPGLDATDVAALQQFLVGLCPVDAATGAELFAANCTSCHGDDARGLNGAPNVRCNRAIADPVKLGRTGGPAGDMPAFATMTDGEIARMQDYLTGLCPAGGASGADLWAGNCTTCHGPTGGGTGTNPSVRCATRVDDALVQGRGVLMPAFPAMGPADRAALGTHMTQLCVGAGRTGADLWAGNCLGCHGGDARGGTNGLGVSGPDVRCHRDIAATVQFGTGTMPAFPGLAPSDVAAVQQFLGGLCPPDTATGAELFAANCTSCHGADARGVNGAPNVRCNRAIAGPVKQGRTGGPAGDMPAFATMTDAEIGRMQDHLEDLCPPGAASGSDLWAGTCATCHGATGGGAGTNPSVRCATRVDDALTRGRGARMPAYPGLVAADRTALEVHMATLCIAAGRTAADLYGGNCASCHGATANGGTDGLGVHGPGIRCTGRNDYREKVAQGDDEMPAFPALGTPDVDAIVDWVHGAYCPGG
jgi:mono/diheme cytochrome c family protein